jgi:hypothetical protein
MKKVINYEKEYPKHFEVYQKLVESVNETTKLINELDALPKTGVENIDLISVGLKRKHYEVIEMFLPIL